MSSTSRTERRIGASRIVALLLLGTVLGCGAPAPTDDQVDAVPADLPPLAPAVSINAEMVALVDHAAHGLWDIGREGMAPESDQDWLVLEFRAIQLAAAGTLITAGGTGPADQGWAQQLPWRERAQELVVAALAAREAARQKDFDGLMAAGDQLIEACEGCHKEYKPELPSEGIVHPHAAEGTLREW